MLLKVVDNDKFEDIIIREGCMFLLPANIPHSPVRFENTVGIVIEEKRPEGMMDRLRWYCEKCKDIVDEVSFHTTDLGIQIKEAVNKFKEDEQRRTCSNCGLLTSTVLENVQDPNVN